MLRYEAPTVASPAEVWPLLARPDRWHEWAWHVRGAWGLGSPEVRAGATGAVRLLGVVPVPVRITAVQPGASWSWRAGPATFRHRVHAAPTGGGVVGIDVSGPGPVLAVLAVTYGPWCRRAVDRIAERAADGRRGGDAGGS